MKNQESGAWGVRGVSEEAKGIAKRRAKKSKKSIGQWLSGIIIEVTQKKIKTNKTQLAKPEDTSNNLTEMLKNFEGKMGNKIENCLQERLKEVDYKIDLSKKIDAISKELRDKREDFDKKWYELLKDMHKIDKAVHVMKEKIKREISFYDFVKNAGAPEDVIEEMEKGGQLRE